ncbi:MAG: DnaJ domain-containing protein [Rhodospirillaceae bacterium]|nr:DnaJ domain-containing protein [Rhodospirillaceae bacterium]
MAPAFLMGLLVVVGVVMFLSWYGRAKTAEVKQMLRWLGIGAGLLLIAFLVLTGRVAAAFAFLMGLVAWAWRVFNMIHMSQQMGGMFRGFMNRAGGAGGAHQTSQVKSAFFAMTLDHDQGTLDGHVLQGRLTGRTLSSLALEDALSLFAEVTTDPESTALLEAFLDRAHPDWRAKGYERAAGAEPSAQGAGAMTEAEALQILGLAKGAPEADIKAAYKRLMGQMHPDRGGSDYLAAKINAAKDFLLKS